MFTYLEENRLLHSVGIESIFEIYVHVNQIANWRPFSNHEIFLAWHGLWWDCLIFEWGARRKERDGWTISSCSWTELQVWSIIAIQEKMSHFDAGWSFILSFLAISWSDLDMLMNLRSESKSWNSTKWSFHSHFSDHRNERVRKRRNTGHRLWTSLFWSGCDKPLQRKHIANAHFYVHFSHLLSRRKQFF